MQKKGGDEAGVGAGVEGWVSDLQQGIGPPGFCNHFGGAKATIHESGG